jgi:hypothetical protein
MCMLDLLAYRCGGTISWICWYNHEHRPLTHTRKCVITLCRGLYDLQNHKTVFNTIVFDLLTPIFNIQMNVTAHSFIFTLFLLYVLVCHGVQKKSRLPLKGYLSLSLKYVSQLVYVKSSRLDFVKNRPEFRCNNFRWLYGIFSLPNLRILDCRVSTLGTTDRYMDHLVYENRWNMYNSNHHTGYYWLFLQAIHCYISNVGRVSDTFHIFLEPIHEMIFKNTFPFACLAYHGILIGMKKFTMWWIRDIHTFLEFLVQFCTGFRLILNS